MRAAFSYYIQGLLGGGEIFASVSDWPLAMSRPVFSRVEGGPRGPTIDRSSRYAGLGSPPSRAVEASVHPSPRAQQGGPLPEMAECSCADAPPQAAEALKGQPWPSGGRHSFRHATLAHTWRCPRRPGWGFSTGPAPESGGRWMEEAVLRGRRHRGPWLAGEGSLQDRGSAGSAAAGRARASGVRRMETKAALGPPGSPGAGRRPWGPGGRRLQP